MKQLRVRYQTIEFGSLDIHLRTLRDTQQYSDDDNIAGDLGISSASWPLFGVVWKSSRVLANLMVDYEVTGLRVLEVGCGIGLASLVLNHRGADITATDIHPDVEMFLRINVGLNGGDDIPFERCGWEDTAAGGLGRFDLIIASDVLYERDHADLLSAFIENHARRHCQVLIVDPGRGHSPRFGRNMVALGYGVPEQLVDVVDNEAEVFGGRVLRFTRVI